MHLCVCSGKGIYVFNSQKKVIKIKMDKNSKSLLEKVAYLLL